MASCVAVIGKTNSPLYLRCVDPNLELSFHYTVHTSLDVVEEKTLRCPPNESSSRDFYIGYLYATESHKVYGYVSNTKIKFIIIIETSSSARESEIRRMFRSLHEAYSKLLRLYPCKSVRQMPTIGVNPVDIHLFSPKPQKYTWFFKPNSNRIVPPITLIELGGVLSPLWTNTYLTSSPDLIYLIDTSKPYTFSDSSVHLLEILRLYESSPVHKRILLVYSKIDCIGEKSVSEIRRTLRIPQIVSSLKNTSIKETAFVLDHSPTFAVTCDEVDFDFQKTRSYLPLPPISKSLWTSTVEAVMEYCRIVWDIFPQDKLLTFVVSNKDCAPRLNEWHEQNSNVVSIGFGRCGRPEQESRRKSASKGYDILNGISSAIEALFQLTEPQRQALNSFENPSMFFNRGRIVCITQFQDQKHFEHVVSKVKSKLSDANESIKKLGGRSKYEFVTFGNFFSPLFCTPWHRKGFCVIPESTSEYDTPTLSLKVYGVEAGKQLSKKLLYFVLTHYELASTTVTGIPMKEEQNASSSANYDVELFHKAEAHARLLGDSSDLVQTDKEGSEYKTITLKWCTPRGSSADLHHCTGSVRITPTDVNSRPSSCLTNFLLSGRSVMLEMPRRASGSKTLSHLMTSHGGEIFIHTLSISRSILEDPPSITEGSGGRVTDYRITDLGELMRSNRLAPGFNSGNQPLDKAKERLARFSAYFPYTISSTTIFNMAAIDPLVKTIVSNDELTEEDLAECRKVIYNLLSMENKGEILPVPVTKSKSGKKEDQYKIMFNELEKFLAKHSIRSERHRKVFECLLEVRDKPLDANKSGGEKVELDVALREIEKYNSMTEREKNEFDSKIESPMSPPSQSHTNYPKKSSKMKGGNKSLLDIWSNRIQKENSKSHSPFAGHRGLGERAKLYLSLGRNKEKDSLDQ
ncbi:Trafficking protein particle complex subunit 2-like protein,Integrator complex subunit 13 [Lepeophtheirus salmonis]|uniref:Protein asunder n=1 Tax=Lepeophtheirus salmonis TaxID=72036 RepID=A0A7R8CL28_LEPSM|nr:Trafficking protein particle complex subunit 2-like protein,Integrator complex subunit 13 [Lepeophtheirus salmonis]CAF2809647.1 Trafficking protein particle complex subunit 2-like protein,Integrator complex subunit 13 [Lepeophtheirus salmonis]